MYFKRLEPYIQINFDLFNKSENINKYFRFKYHEINKKKYNIGYIKNIPILIPKGHLPDWQHNVLEIIFKKDTTKIINKMLENRNRK